MKKIFAISLGLFAVTLLFLGVYNFAFKNNPKNPTVDEQAKQDAKEKAEQVFSEKLKSAPIEKVTDAEASGAATLDASFIGFFSGKSLKKASLGGGAEEALIDNLPGSVLRAVWSPDRKQALALVDMTGSTRWHLIHLENRSVTPLKEGLTSPSWANVGGKIFYFYTDPTNGKTGINTANPDGSAWEELGKSPIGNPFIATVPSSALLSFWNRPNGHEETSLYTVPAGGGQPKRIFSGKFGGNYLWSPNGEHLLVGSVSEKSGGDALLGLANNDGAEYYVIQVPTLISKVAWSKDSKTLYYALPLSMPEGVVLPNDYFDRPVHTADSFWKMDVETGKKERIIDPENIPGEFDSIDLFLDQEESFLFFTNRTDKKLYRIRL